MKNEKITDRILKLIEYKDITKYKFNKDLGFSLGFLDKSREITTDKYANILEYFPEVNPDWLLTGRGEMLKGSVSENANKFSDNAKNIAQDAIPMIPAEAYAGFGGLPISIRDADIMGRYVVPEFKEADFMIQVKGSSMYPKYNSGDIIACKHLKERSFFQWNRVYVIHHREQGTMVKRILQGKRDGYITCRSDNKDYPEFEVPTEEITDFALVIGVIRLE